MNKWKLREELFVRAYLIDLNATKAAIAAGYSEKGADVRGVELLGRRRVQDLVAQFSKEKLTKLDISAEWILNELRKLAGYDASAVFEDDGSLKPISQWDESNKAALVGMDHEKLFDHFGPGQSKHVGTTRKVKLADKLRALELLGKYRKLFTEKIEVSADDTLVNVLNAARKRALGRKG